MDLSGSQERKSGDFTTDTVKVAGESDGEKEMEHCLTAESIWGKRVAQKIFCQIHRYRVSIN